MSVSCTQYSTGLTVVGVQDFPQVVHVSSVDGVGPSDIRLLHNRGSQWLQKGSCCHPILPTSTRTMTGDAENGTCEYMSTRVHTMQFNASSCGNNRAMETASKRVCECVYVCAGQLLDLCVNCECSVTPGTFQSLTGRGCAHTAGEPGLQT